MPAPLALIVILLGVCPAPPLDMIGATMGKLLLTMQQTAGMAATATAMMP